MQNLGLVVGFLNSSLGRVEDSSKLKQGDSNAQASGSKPTHSIRKESNWDTRTITKRQQTPFQAITKAYWPSKYIFRNVTKVLNMIHNGTREHTFHVYRLRNCVSRFKLEFCNDVLKLCTLIKRDIFQTSVTHVRKCVNGSYATDCTHTLWSCNIKLVHQLHADQPHPSWNDLE